MIRNYQKEMEKVIEKLEKEDSVPRLLLHSCCAPCSSYVLEYLSRYFKITVLYYNPNIYPREEFLKRREEQEAFIRRLPAANPIEFMGSEYREQEFYDTVKGYEKIPEGGERCFRCYALRLEEAAREAKKGGYDFFTTTLSISPLKNAGKLNEIGEALAEKYGTAYLSSDFKKKNGYKRSAELSREYGIYRQDYCGCAFSKKEREAAKREQESRQNSCNAKG